MGLNSLYVFNKGVGHLEQSYFFVGIPFLIETVIRG